MKTSFLKTGIFFILAVLLSACNPDEIEEGSIYWNTNTLTRLQLKGKVKTITSGDGKTVNNFNESGYITQTIYTETDFTSTTTYNYDTDGKLSSIGFNSTGSNNITYTTNYTYENIDKYLLIHPYHLLMEGLVPNLKKIQSPYAVIDYYVSGNTVTMIQSFPDNPGYQDTIIMTFNEKYPSQIKKGDLTIKNINYATNGMFTSYKEVYEGTNYYNEIVHYFKSDDEYLLVDSIVYNNTINNVNSKYVERFTYDGRKNQIFEEYQYMEYETSYVYDSQNNWISKSRKSRSKGAVNWDTPVTETRTITYW